MAPLAAPTAAPHRAAVAALAVLLALAGCRGEPRAAPAPTPVEEAAAGWRADAGLPVGTADELVALGEQRLQEDLPASTAAARAAFRAALVRDPGRLDAVAGLAVAFADASGEEPDGDGLREAHRLVAWGRERSKDDPVLLAAQARLLLLAPSASNHAEALALAGRAAEAGGTVGRSPSGAALALGLARLEAGSAGAGDLLLQASRATPADRRLLSAAARARAADGALAEALDLAEARLAQDPGHPGMLALAADVETRAGRYPQAASRLEAWRREDPSAPLPRLLLARLAAQVDGDLPRAAALLDEAAPLATGDFLAARLEAHRAAVALARGDEPAARRAVAAGLARVPASAPARYQAARLAFLGGDRAALRESAGVVGQRCGRPAALLLAARQAELGSDTLEEAAQAWRAWAEATPRDPAAALAAAGAVARIGLSGPALRLAAAGVSGDPLEARLRAEVTDCWEGPAGLAEAARRLESIGTTEPAAAGRAFTAAAACALLTGQTVQAERLARRAAAAAPMAGAPRLLLAQVALDRGRPAEALRLAAAAHGLPGGEGARSLSARALAAAGPPARALAASAAAAAAERGGGAARLGHARLLLRLGRAGEASSAARALLAEDPSIVGARGLLVGR